MNPADKFKKEVLNNIKALAKDSILKKKTNEWIIEANKKNYSYNFSWLGRPIIQYPQDIIALQEIIWDVKPDMIIETGIAHGGSLIFRASLLALLEICGEVENGQVLGIDVDIREHNKRAINKHPLSKNITMLQGSSLDETIIDKVYDYTQKSKRILVCLDSNHTHNHVLNELKIYAPLVSVGSYCVVFDTIVEDIPQGSFTNRPWDKGNNPKTAVKEYIKTHPEFVIDNSICDKLLITVAPDGYLKRIV